MKLDITIKLELYGSYPICYISCSKMSRYYKNDITKYYVPRKTTFIFICLAIGR